MRFLPAQMMQWTGGTMLRAPNHSGDTDRYYPGICTDTRILKPHEAFVALRGDHFDGHRFLNRAVELGADLLVVDGDAPEIIEWQDRMSRNEQGVPDLLLVDDTRLAYQQLAAGYRMMLSAYVIAVTGSVGKTTTRRMIHQMIQSQLDASQSEANLNNEIGLSYTLLSTDPDKQALIAELGMDRPGEIEKLSKIARPDISIITHIGFSHAEYLGSVQDILREKTSIINGMKENGLTIVNGDDPQLESWVVKDHPATPVWYVATQHNVGRLERSGQPVFWAEHIEIGQNGTSFTGRSNLAPEESWKVHLPVAAPHYVTTALFGLAVAYAMGLDMDEAAACASGFVNTGNRLRRCTAGAIDIIDDAYNASPESFLSALQNLEILAGDRRTFVVLGGMRELGRYSVGIHETAARRLAENGVSRVVLIGEETQPAKDMLMKTARGRDIFTGWYENWEAALPRILSEVQDGDFVLIKGSRFYRLENITRALTEAFGNREDAE